MLFILIIIIMERIIPYKKTSFLKFDFLNDLLWYMILQTILLSHYFFDYWESLPVLHHYKLVSSYPAYVQFIITFLILEFIYYWYHRFIHNSKYMWRFHELHHSSPEVNWLSGFRNHAMDLIIGVIATTLILILLGADIEVAILIGSINNFHGIWKHSNIKLKIRFLQYFFVSSEMHRCHHLCDIKSQKSNYGNTLSIYDWIFGTAYYPDEKEYGDKPFGIGSEYPKTFFMQYLHVFRSFK